MDASLVPIIRNFYESSNVKTFSIVLADDSYRMMSRKPNKNNAGSLLVFDDTNKIATCFTPSIANTSKHNDGCVRTTSYDQIMAVECETSFDGMQELVKKKVTEGLLSEEDAKAFLDALNQGWIRPGTVNP